MKLKAKLKMLDLGDIFDDGPVTKVTKEISILQYPVVNCIDWEPVTVIEPSVAGPWIAGGSCLRWYQNRPVDQSDIDIFCANAKQAADVIERIRSTGRYHRKHESENATTFDYWDSNSEHRWTLQVITKRYYADMEDILNNFDVTVCQIATDGSEWQLGKTTARDIREKNLRMRLPLQPDALKRLTKYWIYGYRPVDGLLEAVQNNPVGNWTFSPGEDYS